MRLAATEVRLEFDHGVAGAVPGESLQARTQEVAQSCGEERAPVELDRLAVFVRAFTAVHGCEVGGELGLEVAAGRDVRMGRDDAPPRWQPGRCTSLRQGRLRLLALTPGPLFIPDAEQFLLLALHFFGLCRGADRCQEPPGGVERAVGIVRGERLFVGVPVAGAAEFVHERPLERPEVAAEDFLPVADHQREGRLRVE